MNPKNGESFVTTIDYLDFAEFVDRAQFVLSDAQITLASQLKFVRNILQAAKGARALILDNASNKLHPDILTAICIGFWKKSRRPMVLMMGDMWHKDKGLWGVVQKLLLRLADRSIFRYTPLSTEEFPLFAAAWGIPKTKLRFLPYFYTFTEKDLSAPAPAQADFIFAGGNAHRDYPALIKAIEALPEYQFVIASHLLDGKKLPSNLRAGQVPRTEFISLMRAARAVVTPIKKNLARSTGHQTYLNAMFLEKPSIITNTLGVREYTNNGELAILVDGTPEGFVQGVRKVMDPTNQAQIEVMCKSAHELVAREFSFESHCHRLLEILDEAVAGYYS